MKLWVRTLMQICVTLELEILKSHFQLSHFQGGKLKSWEVKGIKHGSHFEGVLKSRDITLLKRSINLSKLGFSSSHVWMWELDHKEGWALKNLMLLNCGAGERFFRVPWTARRSNQSILKEINPENSLEGVMLKLKCPYYGHLMLKADSMEKTLMLGKIEGRRRRGRQRMR